MNIEAWLAFDWDFKIDKILINSYDLRMILVA